MDAQKTQAVSQTPAIPFKQAPTASTGLASGAVGVLVISLVAIVAVWYLRKRFNLGPIAGGEDKRIRVLETRMLGPRTLLAVVEFGGREHLLAQTEHGITRLADVEAEPRQ